RALSAPGCLGPARERIMPVRERTMRDLWRVTAAELLKLRRTLALRTAVGIPLAVAFLVFGVNLRRPGAAPAGESPLTGFAQLALTLWTILLLPSHVALLAALLGAVEHQGNHWTHLMTLPVRRAWIFAAKWLAGIALLLVSTTVLAGSL